MSAILIAIGIGATAGAGPAPYLVWRPVLSVWQLPPLSPVRIKLLAVAHTGNGTHRLCSSTTGAFCHTRMATLWIDVARRSRVRNADDIAQLRLARRSLAVNRATTKPTRRRQRTLCFFIEKGISDEQHSHGPRERASPVSTGF